MNWWSRSALGAVLAVLALAASPAPAPDGPWKYTPPSSPQGPTPADLLGRLAMLTGVTAGIGLLCVWLTRRASRLPAQTGDAPMQVVGRVALGPRCTLHLLQVEESVFVVGTDLTGVREILPLPGSFDRMLDVTDVPSAAEKSPSPRRTS